MKIQGQSQISTKQQTNPCEDFSVKITSDNAIDTSSGYTRIITDEGPRGVPGGSAAWVDLTQGTLTEWASSLYGHALGGSLVTTSGIVNSYAHVTNTEVSAGAQSFQVDTTSGFFADQLIMIHQTQDAINGNSGVYEERRIKSVSSTSKTITVGEPLNHTYYSNTGVDTISSQQTQIVRIPEFRDLVLNGDITGKAWDGKSGGIIAIKAFSTISTNGFAIDADRLGFRGGLFGPGNDDGGFNGEGPGGVGDVRHSSNTMTIENNTGGGGYGGPGVSLGGCGAGGGSHATAGGIGTSGDGSQISLAGSTYGEQTLENRIHLGSGGGGGGDNDNIGGTDRGGRGGGIVYIAAREILSSGGSTAIRSNGQTADSPTQAFCGPAINGSGAGGSIWVRSRAGNINCQAIGGATVKNFADCQNDGNFWPNGGAGGDGRIRVDGFSQNTSTGETSGFTAQPTAYTQTAIDGDERYYPIKAHGPMDRSKTSLRYNIPKRVGSKRWKAKFKLHHSGSWNRNADYVQIYIDGVRRVRYWFEGYESGEPPIRGVCSNSKGTIEPTFDNCTYTQTFGDYKSDSHTLSDWKPWISGEVSIETDWFPTAADGSYIEFKPVIDSAFSNEALWVSHLYIEEETTVARRINIQGPPNQQITVIQEKPTWYSELGSADASNKTSNWDRASIRKQTTGTLGTFDMHDFSNGSGTLTLNDLPDHEYVQVSAYCHMVDSWDGESFVIRCSDADGDLRTRVSWNKSYPKIPYNMSTSDYAAYIDDYGDLRAHYNAAIKPTGLSKEQYGYDHWVANGIAEGRVLSVASTEWVQDTYSYAPWGNNTGYNGYIKFTSTWMPHTSSTFQTQFQINTNQGTTDEAGYVSHVKVDLIGGDGKIIGSSRLVANDQYGYPFIAVGEGRPRTPTSNPAGKVVVDCFWPKWYTSNIKDAYFTDTSTYPQGVFSANVPGGLAFLSNSVDYCRANRVTKTNKVLYLNDQSVANTEYNYGTNITFSRERFEKLLSNTIGCTVDEPSIGDGVQRNAHFAWITSQNKTQEQWLDYFNQYDCILWWGCNGYPSSGSVQWLGKQSDNVTRFELALIDYVNSGGGIFATTDSARKGPGETHATFSDTVNVVLSYFGIETYGSISRTQTDHYKIRNFLSNTTYIPSGYHPLFKNMHPDQSIYGGSSDGQIRFIKDRAITSVYTIGADGNLVIDQHTGTDYGGDTKLDTSPISMGNLLIRTPNNCGSSS